MLRLEEQLRFYILFLLVAVAAGLAPAHPRYKDLKPAFFYGFIVVTLNHSALRASGSGLFYLKPTAASDKTKTAGEENLRVF